jgi:hypothetical protein
LTREHRLHRDTQNVQDQNNAKKRQPAIIGASACETYVTRRSLTVNTDESLRAGW